MDDWESNFKKNVQKGSKRRRRGHRTQFSPTDKMSKVFAELDAQYKAKVEAGKMSEDTYTNYRCHIYPPAKNAKRSNNPDAFKLDTEMGSLSIAEAADAAWIADFLDEVADSAPSTAYHQHRQLCSAFKLAVLRKGIEPAANPMPYVPRPSSDGAKPRPLTPFEQRGVLRSIENWLDEGRGESRYLRMLYLLLLGTGMRPGEGLAARWCDVTKEDFDGVTRSVLHVCATVRCKANIGPYRNPGRKSGNEYRLVLPDWLATELDSEKEKVSPAVDTLPILQGPRSAAGSWVSVSNARMAVYAVRNRSEFKTFRLSDLRDTVATHVATATGDDERASAQLGHLDGNKSMAQRHYIHQGIRRMVAVDNAAVMELLDPAKVTPNVRFPARSSSPQRPDQRK
ncbi:hypothetical protein GPX89_07510 [Nocardia sp. ET3-3]|uniref:Tyr recombinase domain-containing protein n=1 Tax=Nocardia terrae TaxID=2675851 RepID=A0A7K1URY6_9NOCA|nr:hypothetical protein [Nocardia terrae]MVU77094.1 hypothetical protein [Nocardia terrae]